MLFLSPKVERMLYLTPVGASNSLDLRTCLLPKVLCIPFYQALQQSVQASLMCASSPISVLVLSSVSKLVSFFLHAWLSLGGRSLGLILASVSLRNGVFGAHVWRLCFPSLTTRHLRKVKNNEDQRDVTCQEHNTILNKGKKKVKYNTLKICI